MVGLTGQTGLTSLSDGQSESCRTSDWYDVENDVELFSKRTPDTQFLSCR